jgi:hypothetical protein
MITKANDEQFMDSETIELSEIAAEDNFWEKESLVKDFSRAVRLNQFYSKQLGWNKFHDQVNDLLLSVMGLEAISLNEEVFAQAVIEWQRLHGFEENDCDGIIGPSTWRKMQPYLGKAPGSEPPSSLPSLDNPPPTKQVYAFNSWFAVRILQSMKNGVAGSNFNSKLLLEKIGKGEQVKMVDPHNDIIQALPIIHHICECAGKENYREIVIGSFIRDPQPNGSCTGHCKGRCIDINHRFKDFGSEDALVMVKKILGYLQSLPEQYRKNFGFGLPLQGRFFGAASLPKFKKINPEYLIDVELGSLVKGLGIVFPDNPNHLHIQVDWMK